MAIDNPHDSFFVLHTRYGGVARWVNIIHNTSFLYNLLYVVLVSSIWVGGYLEVEGR